MRTVIKQAVITAAVIAAGTVGISSPAAAANYGSYVNLSTNYCLDSDSAGEAYTLGCNDGAYQDWDIQNISGNLYYLKNRQTARCLDANSSNKVYTLSCNGGTNQRWERVGSGYGQWKNYQTGKCLRAAPYVGRQAVLTENCNSSIQGQKWAKI